MGVVEILYLKDSQQFWLIPYIHHRAVGAGCIGSGATVKMESAEFDQRGVQSIYEILDRCFEAEFEPSEFYRLLSPSEQTVILAKSNRIFVSVSQRFAIKIANAAGEALVRFDERPAADVLLTATRKSLDCSQE